MVEQVVDTCRNGRKQLPMSDIQGGEGVLQASIDPPRVLISRFPLCLNNTREQFSILSKDISSSTQKLQALNSHTISSKFNVFKMATNKRASESPSGGGPEMPPGRTPLQTATHRGVLITPPTFSILTSATFAAFVPTFILLNTTSPPLNLTFSS